MRLVPLRHWLIAGCAAALTLAASATAYATVPQRFVYNGHLLTAEGQPITTPHTVRFSLWRSADDDAGDHLPSGELETAAPNYAGWKDTFTVTPTAQGYFSVVLGSGIPLPDFATLDPADLQSLHLQVEVKADADPLTAYEVLDVDAANTAVDRSPMLSVPFALMADTVDSRHVGSGSGSIPVLEFGGLLSPRMVPGGTDQDIFTLDLNDSASGSIALTFGNTLQKSLSYDFDDARFRFNDDVEIQGDLTVTGLINGVDITNIAGAGGSDANLRASTGAGLLVHVASGDYRLGGTVVQFAGDTITVPDNATSSIYFTGTGLTVSTSGFPTTQAIIPVATAVAAGGAVTSLEDRRIFNSNDAQRTVDRVFEPMYGGSAYEGDGTDNVGQLSVTHSGTVLRNSYQWTSTRPTLQDYDIVLRADLPSGFAGWGATPLRLEYRASENDATIAKMDITVTDTAGGAVTLSGSAVTDLTGSNWSTGSWEFAGAPTWTPGESFLVRLRVYAKDSASMHVGKLILQYEEMP